MRTTIVDYLRVFICLVDGCHHYQNLTERERKYNHDDTEDGKCDKNLYDNGWYRLQGDAGTKMATETPGLRKCGARNPVWLKVLILQWLTVLCKDFSALIRMKSARNKASLK